MTRKKLLVVSNRLPVSVDKTSEGYQVNSSSGGLVTALDSVLRKKEGVWVGWAGIHSGDEEVVRLLEYESAARHYHLQPVSLSQEEVEKFYLGFSNEIIWPLFHDLQSRCNFDPEYWEAYRRVNQRFAEAVVEHAAERDFVWIHDYHFTLVARYLREFVPDCSIGFFQHIPFPPVDIFAKLPWRMAILDGMLHHDVIGFQTERDQRNFIGCIQTLRPDAVIVDEEGQQHVHAAGRCSRVGSFPISIDFDAFATTASLPSVASHAEVIRQQQRGRRIVLGVDRLDYTKGILERLMAFRHLLRRSPDVCRSITLVQLVVPSRADIPRYQELKHEVECLVSEINGEFSDAGWVPIHYMYRHLNREELVAHYRAADIALVTPLKDGMNLVAKEYCASQVEHEGVLILSEFAGAAAQLSDGALIVHPNDQQEVADAILTAYRMPASERRARMYRLRSGLRQNDVYGWSESFLEAGHDMRITQCMPREKSWTAQIGAD